MSINLHTLSKTYHGDKINITALAPTSLEFAEHSFTIVVGKSGCGKTTLLRLLASLEQPTTGSIAFGTASPAIGFVFQEPRLMPWLTVSENIAFAAQSNGSLGTDKLPLLLDLLGLTAFASSYPSQLSGGMAQRTSLGRTLFQNPDIILMDEPFSALDYFTRRGLQETLLTLFRQERKTIIFVTHDVEEAVLLGERVLIMQNGSVTADIPVNLPYLRDPASVEVLALRRRILSGIE